MTTTANILAPIAFVVSVAALLGMLENRRDLRALPETSGLPVRAVVDGWLCECKSGDCFNRWPGDECKAPVSYGGIVAMYTHPSEPGHWAALVAINGKRHLVEGVPGAWTWAENGAWTVWPYPARDLNALVRIQKRRTECEGGEP